MGRRALAPGSQKILSTGPMLGLLEHGQLTSHPVLLHLRGVGVNVVLVSHAGLNLREAEEAARLQSVQTSNEAKTITVWDDDNGVDEPELADRLGQLWNFGFLAGSSVADDDLVNRN